MPPKSRSRSVKRSALYRDMTKYAEHFRPLLQAEKACEQELYEATSRALVLRNVRLHQRPRLLGDAVFDVRPFGDSSALDVDCQLRKGDLVFLEIDDRQDSSMSTDDCVEALVLARSKFSVTVTVPVGSEGAVKLESIASANIPVKAKRGVNCIAYERAQTALATMTNTSRPVSQIAVAICRSLSHCGREVFEELALPSVPTEQSVACNVKKKEETKWETFARASSAGASKKAIAAAHSKVCTIYDPPTMVQRAAILDALSRTVTLIQGPPGTGKTMTAAYTAVGAVFAGCGPVLATAPSNVAVDNLLEKITCIAGNGLGVVRYGRAAAVREALWYHTLDSHLERYPKVRQARQAVAEGSMSASEMKQSEDELSRRILGNADIVLATCVGSGHELFHGLEFRFVVCDEASQATEPDSLIPVATGAGSTCHQLLLVGDHHQLPPTVLSKDSALSLSLFSRLWHCGVYSALLDIQYRMHRQIANFPCKHFYFDKVRTKVHKHLRAFTRKGSEQLSSPLADLLSQKRVVFIDVPDTFEQSDSSAAVGGEAALSSFSLVNIDEARAVVSVLDMMPYNAHEIAIITPYVGQARALLRLLPEGYSEVEVSTVDGFQGREKEAIILSTVRSNDRRVLGFVSDWRRLNVAITRARSALVVVGAGATLESDPFWNKWLLVALRCQFATLTESAPSVVET